MPVFQKGSFGIAVAQHLRKFLLRAGFAGQEFRPEGELVVIAHQVAQLPVQSGRYAGHAVKGVVAPPRKGLLVRQDEC